MTTNSRPGFFEHDSEPVPGLPAALPAGEVIIWQGAPRFSGLVARGLHLRWMAVYFAVLALSRAASLLADGAGLVELLKGTAIVLVVGAVPLGLLALYGWASARSTLYTLTSRRVVIRTGVALPMTVNVPFVLIGNAAMAEHQDGTGDIALQLIPPHRVSWVALWPHVRSWRFSKPQPTLRAVAEPQLVAQALARALAAAATMPVRAMRTEAANAAPGKPATAAMA